MNARATNEAVQARQKVLALCAGVPRRLLEASNCMDITGCLTLQRVERQHQSRRALAVEGHEHGDESC